ncbi:MAG: hypothetical protein KAU62_01940 [Candidatus Heimdallarchaeota archaeon]|nr:hypothetical protein [Candidatus Heimdallarchaeota archaeon]MCK4609894.1 hypothetical protein [Candidatus Heimdallarchaeota archaeon]
MDLKRHGERMYGDLNSLELFKKIGSIKNALEVDELISQLEKAKLISWLPVGGIENNEGTIDSATDPADSLFERVTNAMDAMIELEYHKKKPSNSFDSPKKAIEELFNLEMDNFSQLSSEEQRKIADKIQIIIEESNDKTQPTVTILDKGIGQEPEKFQETFLSLHGKNKIDKFYLMGQYGQGGSTSFAFSKYTIIISNRYNSNKIGWTIVRCIDPGKEYKRFSYQYLTDYNEQIPYTLEDKTNEDCFQNGTIIRMINYAITKYHSQVFVRWYQLCRNALFDAILPFLIYDKRSKEISKIADNYMKRTRVIFGMKNSLMSKKLTNISYQNEIQVPVTNNLESFCSVRYWIFESKTDVEDSYLDMSKAYVVFTLNGQRQHREKKSFIYDFLGLEALQKHMIIQVDCDGLSPHHRKRFFTTTRSTVRETDVKTIIYRKIKESILTDCNIAKILEDLRNEALNRYDEAQGRKDLQRVASLLKRWKTLPKTSEVGNFRNMYMAGVLSTENPSETKNLQHIPTYLKCINKKKPITAQRGKRFVIKFETDAQEDYLTRKKDRGSFNYSIPKSIQIQSVQTRFSNGFFSVICKSSTNLRIGEKISIKFALERPGMSHLEVELIIQIIERKTSVPKKSNQESRRSQEAQPNIKIIRIRNKEELIQAEKTRSSIRSEPVFTQENSGLILVHVNLLFPECKIAREKTGGSTDTIARKIDHYVTYIAAHSISQYNDYKNVAENSFMEKLDVDIREKLKTVELKRIASTIIPLTFKS